VWCRLSSYCNFFMHFQFCSPFLLCRKHVRLKHNSPSEAFKRIFPSSHLRSEIHQHHHSLEQPNKHHFHCTLQKNFKKLKIV
jgi:hypothetical protein